MTLSTVLCGLAALVGVYLIWAWACRPGRKQEEAWDTEDKYRAWEARVLAMPEPADKQLARLGIGVGPCRECSALGTEICNDCER